MNKNIKFILVAVSLLLLLILAYSNHFTNGFYFDDSHTITSNDYIKSLSNTKLFFTNPETFSSLPENRAYRPIVTLLNAIDYSIAGELNPLYFHLSIFLWYIIQLVLMFFFFKKIFDLSFERPQKGPMSSLLSVGIYAFLPANAETINYIISRSDSFSAMCVIAAFVLFQYKHLRKYHLYLIPMLLGLYTKQTGLMFIPLLFFYCFFFENSDGPFLKRVTKSFYDSMPSILLGISIFSINQFILTPSTTVSSNKGVSTISYFISEWPVIVHYVGNFFIPLNLSADPDFTVEPTLLSSRVIWSLILILSMLVISMYCAKQKETRPISFGLLWFFICLAPTSSFVPFFQFANDHRTFFPYVGLTLAVASSVYYFIRRYDFFNRWNIKNGALYPILGLLFIGNSYGIYQRNIVWSDSEKLWYDVTIKSPKNGRGLMNYGLSLMQKGNYDEAMVYFKDAQKLLPRYSYIYINMGVLEQAKGQMEKAETQFKKGISYGKNNPESYYFYANFLLGQNRIVEAKNIIDTGVKISPAHTNCLRLQKIINEEVSLTKMTNLDRALARVKRDKTAENYINLSLIYYQETKYGLCIKACRSALEIDSLSHTAYNNICSSYNKLGEWEKAKDACEKALQINPEMKIAKNNLNWAISELEKRQ